MTLAVEVKNLSVKFGDFFAVKDVSFSVEQGEIFGFLGANGAGKTTTIRVLCGLIKPTEGTAQVAGESFNKSGAALKMKVGYMSQKFTLYDDLTVAENLSLAANLHRMTKKDYARREKELLDFIQWKRPLDSMVKDLPGGLKQQVSLVASMMHDPQIVFLDEPTAGVSPQARAKFWELIRQIANAGKTVFVTTHYMDEAEQCGRIALMRSGELVALDSPDNLKIKCFPKGLWELDPKVTLTSADEAKIKETGNLSLFEPYGLKYHLEFNSELNTEIQKSFDRWGTLKKVNPSLEDVFIRVVEGASR